MISFRKRFLVLVITLSLILTISQSKAILPVIVAVASSQTAVNVSLGILGVAAAYLAGQQLRDLELTKANGDKVRMPLTDLPQDRPVSNPGAPLNAPVVPATNTITCNADIVASCAQYFTNSTLYYTYTVYPATCSCRIHRHDGSDGHTMTFPYTVSQVPASCPAGYSLTNGSCVLTSPERIPDGNCDIEAFSPAAGVVSYRDVPNDSDCDGGGGLTIAQGAALFSMMHPDNPNSLPSQVSIDPSGGTGDCPYSTCLPIPALPGHFRITAFSNNAAGSSSANVIDINKQTGVVSQSVSVPLNGTILSAGTVYTNTAGQSAVVPANSIVLANPAAAGFTQVTVNSPAVSSPAINIPTDYARSGEATSAANIITNKFSETVPDTDLLEPVLTNPLTNYFNPLRSWSVPVQSGNCPSGSFSWNNNDYNFDVMCTLFNNNLTIIQASMNVMYVLAALFIVLGA